MTDCYFSAARDLSSNFDKEGEEAMAEQWGASAGAALSAGAATSSALSRSPNKRSFSIHSSPSSASQSPNSPVSAPGSANKKESNEGGTTFYMLYGKGKACVVFTIVFAGF